MKPIQINARLLKADEEDSGFVLAPVLVPEEEDSQGDVVSEEEIEKAAHDFMESFETVGLMHQRPLAKREASVVESYITRSDMEINGEQVRKGTWLLGIRIHSPQLREAVKSGKLTGLSIGGAAAIVEEEG